MSDHGVKYKLHKYKFENAVDMSTHLEEVISQYAKKNSFPIDLLPRLSPPIVQEPEKVSLKDMNACVKEEGDLFSTPSLSLKDNHSAASLASTSSLSLGATANPSPPAIDQAVSQPTKRKYVYKLKCSQCKFRSSTAQRLVTHVATHHGKRFKCDLCDYQVIHKARLITHKAKVHQDKTSFDCVLCGDTMNTKDDFLLHMTGHGACAQEGRYICIVRRCSYAGNYRLLLRHLTYNHSNIDKLDSDGFKTSKSYTQESVKYPCHICEFFTYRKVNLRLHFQFKHSHLDVEKLVNESNAALQTKTNEEQVTNGEVVNGHDKQETTIGN